MAGRLSPDGRHLVYASNKDCPEAENVNAMSVFLFDMYDGTESVLLSGKDDRNYSTIDWLDDETLLCSSTSYDDAEGSTDGYLICDLAGKTTSLEADAFTGPFPFALQGKMLAYITGPEGKSFRLVRIEEDGTVSELARKEFDGNPINFGGISPDGKWMAFTLSFNSGDRERAICLWNTGEGSVGILGNPISQGGGNPAPIQVKWDGEYPEVDFNVSNYPDSNGHNELWRYTF